MPDNTIYQDHVKAELKTLIDRLAPVADRINAGDTITIKIGTRVTTYEWMVNARDPMGFWSPKR